MVDTDGGYRYGNSRFKGRGCRMNNSNTPHCQLCGRFRHVAICCYYMLFLITLVMEVLVKVIEWSHIRPLLARMFVDPSWTADSGAKNHCTPISDNLQFRND